MGMLPFLGAGVAGDSDTLVLLGGNTYGGGEAGLHDKGFDLNGEAMPGYWGYAGRPQQGDYGEAGRHGACHGPGSTNDRDKSVRC